MARPRGPKGTFLPADPTDDAEVQAVIAEAEQPPLRVFDGGFHIRDPKPWTSIHPPTYCGACGRVMQDEVWRKPAGFDRMTGQARPDFTRNVRRCPQASTIQGDDHDYFALP